MTHSHGHNPNSRQRGQRNGNAKLTADLVLRMRQAKRFGWAIGIIAETFGVSVSTASKAINRRTWRHVR